MKFKGECIYKDTFSFDVWRTKEIIRKGVIDSLYY